MTPSTTPTGFKKISTKRLVDGLSEGKDESQRQLVVALVQNGILDEAEAIAAAIDDDYWRVLALCDIARAATRAEVIATRSLLEAKRIIGGLTERKDELQTQVVNALVQNGILEEAEAIAAAIDDDDWRTFALSAISRAAAGAAQVKVAERLAFKARDGARSSNADPVHLHDDLLGAAATALAAADQLDEAMALAREIKNPSRRTEAIVELGRVCPTSEGTDKRVREAIAQAQTRAADHPDPEQRAEIFHEVARAWAALGDSAAAATARDAALNAAREIVASVDRRSSLIWMAQDFVESGDTDRLLAAAADIPDAEMRAEALIGIASAQAESDTAKALKIWRHGLQQARETTLWSVYQCLREGASILGDLDDGKTLSGVCDAILEVENWWQFNLPSDENEGPN